MKAWEEVIHTAMLGTDKPMTGNADLSEEIAAIAREIDTDDKLDKENKFLKKAALIYNYRQCGFVPVQKPDLNFTSATPETKSYCSPTAASLLNAIFDADSLPLLKLWL